MYIVHPGWFTHKAKFHAPSETDALSFVGRGYYIHRCGGPHSFKKERE